MRRLLSAYLLLCGLWTQSAHAAVDSVTIREPETLGSLTIWFIDSDSSSSHPYLTLEQALQSGRAAIHENNSQRLWIENNSDTDLFLESADLMKGGQQDRMVARDMIVPAHDTSRDLDVYCVEHGRSTKRGSEPVETFSASHWMAPQSHTRLVALHSLTGQLLTPHVGGLTAPDTTQLNLLKNLETLPQPFGYIDAAQESVWNDVMHVQSGLTQALKDSVTKNASPTSLELALENGSLVDREHSTEARLERIANKDDRATGFVYAIDGHIVGAERYGSRALFAAMWPKLARTIVTEAILDHASNANRNDDAQPTMEGIREFLAHPNYEKSASESVNDRTRTVARKSDAAYCFDTFDANYPEHAVHSAWIARDDP